MVKVNIIRNNNIITNVEILGHAMYEKKGLDIVCASISATVITTINGIIKLNKNYIEYESNNKGMVINILKNNNIVNSLINNMIDLLKELSINYPKNIEIKEC